MTETDRIAARQLGHGCGAVAGGGARRGRALVEVDAVDEAAVGQQAGIRPRHLRLLQPVSGQLHQPRDQVRADQRVQAPGLQGRRLGRVARGEVLLRLRGQGQAAEEAERQGRGRQCRRAAPGHRQRASLDAVAAGVEQFRHG